MARERSYSGAAGSPVASSIDSPAMPVATQSFTFSATPSGSSEKPAWKSALTGIEVAATTSLACASMVSREIASKVSGSPRVKANPAELVASALKPRC